MSWSVTVRAKAKKDLLAACEWYNQQREGLGKEFQRAIEDAIQSLRVAPHASAIYYRDLRRIITNRFPFKMFYRIKGESVIVLRILHAARNHLKELE